MLLIGAAVSRIWFSGINSHQSNGIADINKRQRKNNLKNWIVIVTKSSIFL